MDIVATTPQDNPLWLRVKSPKTPYGGWVLEIDPGKESGRGVTEIVLTRQGVKGLLSDFLETL